jgi:Ca-activated chloride channel family protein
MRYFVILSAALILAFSGLSYAQDVERVETNLVTLNVAVTNKTGKNVLGLSKGDFSVFDNGKRQDIDTFSAENAPVSFGIVYDLHPTTDEQTAGILAALKQFAGGLTDNDDYFVTVFNEQGSLTTDFVPTAGQVREQIGKGPKSLYDAIFAASNRVSSMKNPKKVLLVITDGADHASDHSPKELRLHLRSINLPVYSVTFSGENRNMFGYSELYRMERPQRLGIGETSTLDRGMLVDISKRSGGQSFEAELRNRYYLAALCEKVRDEVKNHYILGFYPENADGKWHKLTVSVNGQKTKKYKLSNRTGYQSPRKR